MIIDNFKLYGFRYFRMNTDIFFRQILMAVLIFCPLPVHVRYVRLGEVDEEQ